MGPPGPVTGFHLPLPIDFTCTAQPILLDLINGIFCEEYKSRTINYAVFSSLLLHPPSSAKISYSTLYSGIFSVHVLP
jgi:hypothetical protein